MGKSKKGERGKGGGSLGDGRDGAGEKQQGVKYRNVLIPLGYSYSELPLSLKPLNPFSCSDKHLCTISTLPNQPQVSMHY